MSILVFKPTLLKSFHKRVKDRDKNLGLQNENQHHMSSPYGRLTGPACPHVHCPNLLDTASLDPPRVIKQICLSFRK